MTDRVGQQFGNYQLVKLLGRGGSAEVYLGKHRYLNSYAALKVSKTTIVAADEQKFLAEAQTLVDLHHPHIVRLLDFSIENGTPMLITEYAPQGSLRQYCTQGMQVAFTTVIDWVMQVASALQYAHNHHIIHRDVKPENILLDANHHLLLSDFGISLLTQSGQLSTQDLAGTLRYIAPEQLSGKPCFASDQYALAVMVYEWLCGVPPFHGNAWELWHHHVRTDPPPLRTICPELPLALEQVVLRALAKKSQDRFVSVQAFALALARASQTASLVENDASQVTSPLPLIPRAPSIVLPEQISARPVTEVPKLPYGLALRYQNRMRLLQRVRAFWITGVFEQSLHGAALIALGLQDEPDAVANPWQLMIQEQEQVKIALSPGTRITEVYDASDNELLILGEPGAGKTTLLLELARDLLKRAEQEHVHPIPVIFNLSSWSQKRQPLTAWLIEELETKYQVPRKIGSDWINTDQILPLLDGLDEVDATYRAICMRMINEYHHEHSLVPLVVCCRINEYASQTNRLVLYRAVTIQPLTIKQVNEYLTRIGEKVASLRIVLQHDPVLQELATTPLMLTILILTYQGSSLDEIKGDASAETRQRQIFAMYTQRMLRRQRTRSRYEAQQTIHWLSYLAQQMKQKSQTVFYIEQMQPSWLPKASTQRIYEYLGIRFPGILMGILVSLIFTFYFLLFFSGSHMFVGILSLGLLGAWLGNLLSCNPAIPVVTPQTTASRASVVRTLLIKGATVLGSGILVGLGTALITAPNMDRGSLEAEASFGDLMGLVAILLILFIRPATPPHPSNTATGTSRKPRWYAFLHSPHIRNGWLVGSMIGLSFSLYSVINVTLSGIVMNGWGFVQSHIWLFLAGLAAYGLFFGLPSGLMAVLLSVILTDRSGSIQPIERLSWSWKSLGRNLINIKHMKNVLYIGLIVFLLGGLFVLLTLLGPSSSDTISTLLVGLAGIVLSVIAIYWIIFGLLRGVTGEQLDEQRRIVPNYGIHRSARNGLLFGIVGGIICLLLSPLVVTVVNIFNYTLPIIVNILPDTSSATPSDLSHDWGFLLFPILVFCLANGLVIALLTGWLACIRHYILRWLLWRSALIPRNYARFLDHAAERVLLRKAGGGYIFIHRLLLDYFASLQTSSSETVLAASMLNTAHEENTLSQHISKKAAITQEKRLSILFITVILLISLISSASILSIVLVMTMQGTH